LRFIVFLSPQFLQSTIQRKSVCRRLLCIFSTAATPPPQFESTSCERPLFFYRTPRSLLKPPNMSTAKPAPDVPDETPPPPYDLDGPSTNSQSKTSNQLDADNHLSADLEDGLGTNVKPPRQTEPVGCCRRSCCWMFLVALIAVTFLL
jgi:hypothetical protein